MRIICNAKIARDREKRPLFCFLRVSREKLRKRERRWTDIAERGRNYVDYRYRGEGEESRWVRNCIEMKLRVGKLRLYIGLVLAIHLLRRDPLLDPVEEAAKREDRCNFDWSRFDESLKIFFENVDALGNVVDEAIP